MSFSLGFGSCFRGQAPVRFDLLCAKTKAFYWMGDAAYMDASLGGTGGVYNGEATDANQYTLTGTGCVLTIGAATTMNGVAGQLPIGACTVTNGGTGYPASGSFRATVAGQGGSGAVVSCTVNGSGVITAATLLTYGRGYTNTGGPATFSLENMPWTSGKWLRRFDQLFTVSEMAYLQQQRALGYKVYFTSDDHERDNNWDFSIAQAPSGCDTLAKVLDWWRISKIGMAAVHRKYFDNTPGGTSLAGDIPANMVGVTGSNGVAASASEFVAEVMRHDYDANGNLTNAAGAGPLAVTVITTDCISGKHPMTATDNASKLMMGLNQIAWFKAQCLDAMAKGVKQIWGLCGKDFFNADNQDGWRAAIQGDGRLPYITACDSLLQWIQDNRIPIIWMTGDRHCWHVAERRVSTGSTYDHLSVCATPLGATNGTTATLLIGNTPYPEMVAQGRRRDQLVHGVMTWDSVNNQSIFQVLDNCDDTEQFAAVVPAGARVPQTAYGYRQARQNW